MTLRLRRPWLWIAAFAIVLRVYSLNTYVEQHPKRALGAVSFLFEPGNIAYSIVTGRGFGSPFRVDTGPTAWMTPVYPGILAGIFRLFGPYTYDSFLSAALLNILFSALTCVPVYFIGKRVAGEGLGALAAMLWAIFPNAILLPYESLWDQSLGALIAAALLWAAIARRAWWEQGLLWGLALMTTPTLAAALPFLLVWMVRAGRRARDAALIAALAVVCCLPWTLRNYAVFHTLVPLRSVMGLSMWLGNNPRADGVGPGNLHPIANTAERDLYVEQGEIAYNREKGRKALTYMAQNPARTLALIGRRFTAIWSGGTAHPLADFMRTQDLWFRWVLGCNILAGLFAAAGVVLLFRAHNVFALPLAVFPLTFPIAYYLTLAPPRYRHPIDPAVLILAAVTLRAIWQTGNKYTFLPVKSEHSYSAFWPVL